MKLKGARVADALIDYARREGNTQVVFGQSARSRWDVMLHGSIIIASCAKSATIAPLAPTNWDAEQAEIKAKQELFEKRYGVEQKGTDYP